MRRSDRQLIAQYVKHFVPGIGRIVVKSDGAVLGLVDDTDFSGYARLGFADDLIREAAAWWREA